MATLALAAAGSAIGGSIGGTFLGVSSAVLGQAIGATVGRYVDGMLFSSATSQTQKSEGPRTTEYSLTTSSEGESIVKGYGYFRTGGNLIWATRFREEVDTETTTTGGKGGGSSSQTYESTTYTYYCSFAIAICEGEIGDLVQIFIDGQEDTFRDINYRVYRGTETQTPDDLIETIEGDAPAFRGIAYVVFEDFNLTDYSNRIPQFSFVVNKPLSSSSNPIRNLVKGVNLLPGSGEFECDPQVVRTFDWSDEGEDDGYATNKQPLNIHGYRWQSDFTVGVGQLRYSLPNANHVNFIATWFGDSLSIGGCEIRPRVEQRDKNTLLTQSDKYQWQVDQYSRDDSSVIPKVSRDSNGNPVFGGSFNDQSVIASLEWLKSIGLEILYYPFIMMDIPSTNTLNNPYSDNASSIGQSPFPWRGRITCSPARGYAGSVDGTATAESQVAAFFGTATASDFDLSGDEIEFTGPSSEWSYSRFILHQACLCKIAGGVNYFCIGTEMVGATKIRGASGNYPFVDKLKDLADQVRILLPSAQIGYTADWSEYHSDRFNNNIYFNLDPLWSHNNIDFIGIDNYLPMSDWRDGTNHLDYLDGYHSLYDIDYLKSNIEGGEYYDWYYATDNDRATQNRSIISDSAYSKPWVYRQKDVRNWWKNAHYDRTANVESSTPTAWTASSKPIIWTEFGAPCVDKATNQPNVFYDPKSSESAFPYFSTGSRDEDIQKQYIRAFIEYWTDNNEAGFLQMDQASLWAWDTRPFPSFPFDTSVWGDSENYSYGHWVNGRAEGIYVPDLLEELAAEFDVSFVSELEEAYGSFYGFSISGKDSFRSIIESISGIYNFNIIESGDQFKAVSKKVGGTILEFTNESILASSEIDDVKFTIMQESDLPKTIDMTYLDIAKSYDSGTVRQTREVTGAYTEASISTGLVMDNMQAQKIVDEKLYDTWARRKTASFEILPQYYSVEPGDLISVDNKQFRVTSIVDSYTKKIEAESYDLSIFSGGATSSVRAGFSQSVSELSAPIMYFMDLPVYSGVAEEWKPKVAAWSTPFQGANIFRSTTTSGYSINSTLPSYARIGYTTSTFVEGPTDVFDNDSSLSITLYAGSLSSVTYEECLNGANLIAVETSSGNWEIIAFQTVELTGSYSYTLTNLIRGLHGTEDNIVASLASGARVTILSSSVGELGFNTTDIGIPYYYRYGPISRDIGDDSYVTRQFISNGRGLKPLSPVHVTHELSGSNYIFSWYRRTRINGDSWEYTTDIPLNEAYESYQIDIKNSGGTVVRTLTSSTTNVTYTSAQQISDGVSAPFSIVIYQMSDQVGRGIGRTYSID